MWLRYVKGLLLCVSLYYIQCVYCVQLLFHFFVHFTETIAKVLTHLASWIVGNRNCTGVCGCNVQLVVKVEVKVAFSEVTFTQVRLEEVITPITFSIKRIKIKKVLSHFWWPVHFSAYCHLLLDQVHLSVCLWQVRALRKRWEMGLWLLWGTYRKAPPGYSYNHPLSPNSGLTTLSQKSQFKLQPNVGYPQTLPRRQWYW